MTQLTTFVLSFALTTAAVTAWAEAPAEATEAPTDVVEGVAADASPEAIAERDELAAQWEADARAAGLDPDKEEAKSEPESGGSK